jgi:hypothetical protein
LQYEEDASNPSISSSSRSFLGRPESVADHQQVSTSDRHRFNSKALSHDLDVDPFLHETLRGPTVDIAMTQEANKIMGTADDIKAITDKFFDTMWARFPIICPVLFRRQLPSVFSQPHADFIVLCTSIHLLLQFPTSERGNMHSSLYVTIKRNIALLEATNFMTLSALQARLLVTLYETGHGILPAASISVAGCARMAHALGLNNKKFQNVPSDDIGKMTAEQEKRARWGTILLDRYDVFISKTISFRTS